jgi:peptidoglycan/LPS O-acetylase OafA/YrhL
MLPLGPKFLHLNDAAGAMGMSLFFSLSGFLITTTLLHNSDVAEFVVKRVARIVPLAYAYAFLVFSLVIFDPAAALWTCSFLLNYVTQYMVGGLNNHFWSLCVEMQFYAAIALVVLLAGRRGLWIVWPACLIITAIRIHSGIYIAIQTHLRVDEILVGACVATLYRDSWAGRLPFPMLCAGLAALLWFASSNPHSAWLQYLRPYATGLMLAAVLGQIKTPLYRALTTRPMRYIAAISYALYVIHPLTTHGWLGEGSVYERYLIKRPISLLLSFAGAHLSTFHWEKFWIGAGRNWIRNRRARLAQTSV